MTQEEKQLLLKDLCARLPYKVYILFDNGDSKETKEMGLGSLHDIIFNNAIIKPYLRPMSDMTDEEIQEAENNGCIIYLNITLKGTECSVKTSPKGFDYLNSIHVDYRGLIPKGLALEATENIYKSK